MRRWLLAGGAVVASAAPALAEAAAAGHDPLWTAFGLGSVIVVAYGVTRWVARPLMRDEVEADGQRHMQRAEIDSLRACADDLTSGVVAVDGDGRILFANGTLRDRDADAFLPGRRLAAAGDDALRGLLHDLGDSTGEHRTEARLSWGPARLRGRAICGDAGEATGAVIWFEEAEAGVTQPATVCGSIAVDRERRRALVDGHAVELTSTEYQLLAHFVAHAGQVLSRADLLRDVWGHKAPVYSRTVDTHVQRLRDKLGAHRDRLQTVRGAGYRFRAA